MPLKLGIQTYQTLRNDDEVCIPILSSILLAVTSKLTGKISLNFCGLLRKPELYRQLCNGYLGYSLNLYI